MMANLVKYGMLNESGNALAGYLAKAQCDMCGKKYGSLEEAKKCESKHMNNMLNNLNKLRGMNDGQIE